MIDAEDNKCVFCSEYSLVGHLCAKMFTYRHIFRPLLMNTYTTYESKSIYEFFYWTMCVIFENNMFSESPDPFEIVWENVNRFVDENGCF